MSAEPGPVARALRAVVIGAGAAGLAAAARLARAGIRVTVVEARDRLGGRIDTRPDPVLGVALEHGAEFVHGRPGETLSLARRAGARVREVPDRHLRRRGARAANADAAFAQAQELLTVGSRDDEPFAAVVRRTGAGRRGEAASLATEFVRGFYLADPRTASSLALARMTRAIEETGDAIGRVDGGYARVLEPLVRDVRANGGELRLSTVVDELRWRRGHVRVAARGLAGARLRPIEADRAVVTLPLSLLKDGDVRFVPALREKGRAAAALAMGPIVKVLLRFRRPPWRDAGRRALAFLHVAGAPVPVFWTLATR